MGYERLALPVTQTDKTSKTPLEHTQNNTLTLITQWMCHLMSRYIFAG